MKKLEGSLPPKTGQANPSTKRKPSKKVDRPPKKPKIVMRSTVGETPAINKLPPSLVQERKKTDKGPGSHHQGAPCPLS